MKLLIFQIFIVGTIVMTVINSKVNGKLKARERTLFGMLNSQVDLDETANPPFDPSCKKNETIPLDENKNATFDPKYNVTIVNVTQPMIIIPTSSPSCNEKWNYASQGNDWECTCAEGNAQSPIDLPAKAKASLSPVRPIFNYESVNSDSKSQGTIDGINAVDGDNAIKLRYHNGVIKLIAPELGKVVKIDGSLYVAEEIQFHTPAEHTIAGEKYDMEMQIIHYGRSQGDIAKQVVLSFLFKKTPGRYNKFIDSLDFYSLPNPKDSYRELYNDIYIPNVFYSSEEEGIPVMKPFSFYTYEGSLTFPPCTERTTYYVAAEPIELSSTALSLFREALRKPDSIDSKGNIVIDNNPLQENNRGVKPLNGREVFIYDVEKYNCPEFKKKAPKEAQPQGHFEKRSRILDTYIFVNGQAPSGIPGSFVVSENEAKGVLGDEKDADADKEKEKEEEENKNKTEKDKLLSSAKLS